MTRPVRRVPPRSVLALTVALVATTLVGCSGSTDSGVGSGAGGPTATGQVPAGTTPASASTTTGSTGPGGPSTSTSTPRSTVPGTARATPGEIELRTCLTAMRVRYTFGATLQQAATDDSYRLSAAASRDLPAMLDELAGLQPGEPLAAHALAVSTAVGHGLAGQRLSAAAARDGLVALDAVASDCAALGYSFADLPEPTRSPE